MTVVYADTSALVKLVIAEPESGALVATLGHLQLLSSRVAAVELSCVLRRREVPGASAQVETLLDRITLLRLDDEILRSAQSTATNPRLRALDALHLASARRARDASGPLPMLCYDSDLAAAARNEGFEVLAPT